jgi:RNA polymerase sigma-70 factor (ECF subfamily)
MDSVETAYRRHFASVFRYALSVAGRRDVAEDLTAEAFLELQRHADAIRLDQLPAWLFVVVRNRARDLWRRQIVEQKYAPWLTDSAAADASGAGARAWLADAGLKPVQRLCLELHYVWGYTVAEIARRLGMTDGQVKGHIQRALQHLRHAARTRSGE